MSRFLKILSATLCILMVVSLVPLCPAKAAEAGNVTLDDMVKAAGDVIRPNEGSYGSVNPDDNGAVSIGWIQWHANRALNLLRSVISNDQAVAKELLGKELFNEITDANTIWKDRTVTEDEAARISALLLTQHGKDEQDKLASADISIYINHAAGLGVKDPSALVYHADIENQCGWGGAKRVLDAASTLAGGYDKITIDILYEASLADSVSGKYAVRRQKTYNNCLLLEWAEMKTDLEVWDILSVRNVREAPDTQSALLTSIPAGMKVIISEKVYYAAENSTRAKTTMGWITLDAKSAALNRELSGGSVPAPINFDTNGGSFLPVVSSTTASKMNSVRGANEIIIYNSEYAGKKTQTNAYGSEAVIDSTGLVTKGAAYGACKTEIPAGGYVLSAHGTMHSWLSSNIKTGYYVSINEIDLSITVYEDKNAFLAATGTSETDKSFGELPIPHRNGYMFCGWKDTAGNDIGFNTVCDTALCVTLKAEWLESEGTSIIFDKDGGIFKGTCYSTVSGVNTDRVENSFIIYYGTETTNTNPHGTEICVGADGRVTEIFGYGNGNAPIPEGGFVISTHGTASLWLTEEITVGSIVEFNEEEMTVTAYKDDSTYEIIHKAVTPGSPIGTLPEIERPYHLFLGWFNASGEKATKNDIMPEAGMLLTAKWEVLPGSIVYNTDGGTITSLKAETTLTGTNTPRGANALILYNGRAATSTNSYGTEVLVGNDGIVDFVHPAGIGNTVIPAGSFVLSGHGTMSSWLSANVSAGNYVEINKNKVTVWESKNACEAEKNTSVLYGNKVGALHTPKKEGHVFLGWQDSTGNMIEPGSTVSVYGDLCLNAIWERLLTVTFDPGDGVFSTAKTELVAKGVNIQRGADSLIIYTGKATTQTNIYGTEVIVSKDGIVTAINGYGKGNSPIPDGGMVISAHGTAASQMLKAVKLGSYISVRGYKICVYDSPAALDCEDGTLFVKSGSALGALPMAQMPTKALSGWEKGGVRYTKDTVITEDLTLFASWTAISATVVFNPNGGEFGSIISSQKVNGTNMLRPADSIIVYDSGYAGGVAPTNKYGTEVSVDASGTVLTSPVYGACKTKIPSGGLVISGIGTGYSWIMENLKAGRYVNFDKATLTLSVYESYSDYLAGNEKTIYANKTYGPLPTPQRDGYRFCGWQDSLGNTVTEGSVVSDCDTPVLTAAWVRQYSVSFDLDGGTTEFSKASATGINSVRGANDLIIYFGVASTNTNAFGTEAAIDKSGKVVAVYPYGNKNAAVPNGGYVLSGHGTMGTWIQNNLKAGYFVTINDKSITVYQDEFNMNVLVTGTVKADEGSALSALPAVKKTGHIFLGWYSDGELFDESTPISSDISLTARWETRRVSIKYNLNGGKFPGSATNTADGKNILRPAESIIIYDNKHHSSSTGTNIYGAEIVVSADGIVTEVRGYGMKNAPIPEGGYVLSGHNTAGTWLVNNFRVGDFVVLSGNKFTVYENAHQYELICNKTVLYGEAIGELPDISRVGARFDGWLLPDGTIATPETIMSFDSDEIVLKAKWK
ncbi:MAG: InlB B-repeat-containing protein [Clostridia bacterium]|nr:InlB B-repeat-containing protein [Clostridia bacterium]